LTDWDLTSEAFSREHPCLPGHFPGNPIIPGTLILDRVIETLQQSLDGQEVREVVSVKFLRPLLPEQTFSIAYQDKGKEIRFDCRIEEQTLCSGRLKLGDLREAH
jgi:3-hydroxymyristoyl/3-hydroxydecanoyl-(acyl carrier protein) dehydratase